MSCCLLTLKLRFHICSNLSVEYKLLPIVKQEKPMKDKPMNIEDVAEYLQLHINTVYKLARAGSLPHSKIGRQYRFNKQAIDKKISGE